MDIYKVKPAPSEETQDNSFEREGLVSEEFRLQVYTPAETPEPKNLLRLPPNDLKQAEFQPQMEFDGMAKPSFAITLEDNTSGPDRIIFKNAQTLLEALEAQQVQVAYQCRDGYCGACRCKKITGDVMYLKEPMAWVNDDEILPCVSVPTSDLELKFNG